MRISLLLFASIVVAGGIGLVALGAATPDGQDLAAPRSDALAGGPGITPWKSGRRLRGRCQRQSSCEPPGPIGSARPVDRTSPGIDPECELYSLGNRRRRQPLVVHANRERRRFVAATSGVRSPLLAS